jgi:translocation and assembly module TamA
MTVFHAAIISFMLLVSLSSPLFAADPVEVEVTGVEGPALKNVEEAVTLPYGLVRDGVVDRLWLERFATQVPEKAKTALEPFGYYHPAVAAKVEDRGGGYYRLRVTVLPGPPVQVGSVEVSLQGAGAGERSLRQLVREFPVRKGQVLLQPEYERGKSILKARAVELGYLDADFSRHEIRIAAGETAARIAVTLDTGPRYRFGDIRIQGAEDYPDEYLQHFLAFKKGDVFSYAKIGETQINFSNSERFKSVIINPEKERAAALQVPVVVLLTEAKRRSIRPGVGYGTDTGARFSIRYRDLNLFRLGHDFDSTLYIAQNLKGLAAKYTRPSPVNIRTSTSAILNLQEADVTTYTSRLAALELDYNRGLGEGEVATPYIKLQYENFTIGTEHDTSRLVLPGFRFTKERFDNLIRPMQGYRYSLDLRGAHPAFGSDSALGQFIAEGNAVLPFPWRLSLHLSSKLGASLLADPLADFPPSIRFFAGGDQSVRGYSYQSLGPKNALGQVVGGRDVLTGSVELERALYKNWGVSVFHDAGNAFNTFTNVHLYQGAGIGLHYYTPVGGLHLSLARRLDWPKEVYYIHFTVGFQL